MNCRGTLFIAVILVLVACAAVYGVVSGFSASSDEDKPVEVSPELNASLAAFHSSFLSRTTQINDELLATADALSNIQKGDPQLDVILRELYSAVPASIGVCYVESTGAVGRSAPLASLYTLVAGSELKDINESSFANESVLFIGPLSSPSYGEVVCFAALIHGSDGTYKGYACIALWPADLISETSYPGSRYYHDTPFQPWIVSTDGLIISSPSTVFVGENLLEASPLHQTAVNSPARKILAYTDGAVHLTMSDSSERVAVWTSASVSGREMRLVLTTAGIQTEIPLSPVNPHAADLYNATKDLYLYAAEHGQTQTLAELSRPQGIFSSETLRYFAYDLNGTTLFDGFTPQYAGENMLNFRDAYGLRIVATEILRAQQGGGYVYLYAPVQSDTADQAVLCILYVLPVDDDWLIAVVQSILDHTVTVEPSKRNIALRAVQNASSYLMIHGKEAVLQEIMNPDSVYRNGYSSLFAMDYNGTILADSLYPDLVGKNVFFFIDMHGASTMREIVTVARTGGGYCYLGISDSEIQESVLCLVYVEPMGDDWCIGSAVILDRIPLEGWQQSTGDMYPGNVSMLYLLS